MPPCWISLQEKILRTIFVNSMWLHATDPQCFKLQPENCGLFVDDYLKPTGFIWDQTPLTVQDIAEMTEEENSDECSELEDISFTSDESDLE